MILFIIAIFSCLICSILPLKRQYLLLPASFIFLFIFSAFRGLEVGTDTLNYETYYQRIYSGEEWIRTIIEPGWVLINDIAINISNDFRTVLILSTLMVLIPLFYVIYKYSNNVMLSLFVYLTNYYYLASMNVTRQMISASIVLIALILLNKRKNFWFIAFILISSLFHVSSLVFVALLFVNKLTNKAAILTILSILSIIIGIFGIDIIIRIISLTSFSQYVAYNELGNKLGNFFYLILLNIFAISITLTTSIRNHQFKLFWFTVILASLFARIPFGDRLLLSLNIYYIVFFPYYIANAYVGNKNYKLIATALVVTFCLFKLFTTISGGEIFPYTNILF